VAPPDDRGPKNGPEGGGGSDTPDPKPTPHEEEVVPAEDSTPVVDEVDNSSLSKLAAVALQTFAFPLLLAILVGLYLLLQHWFDRRDPKLAMAPVHSNHDLAAFG
jgi:hypothetical protein